MIRFRSGAGGWRAALLPMLALILMPACHRRSVVVLDVTLAGGFAGLALVEVEATLSAAGEEDAVETFPDAAAGPIVFPVTLAVSMPGRVSGDLAVTVRAFDAGGVEQARGSATVAIDRHRSTRVTITLVPICGNGEPDPGEGCDDGLGVNSDTAPDACRTTCVPAACGDGVVDGPEGCDDGAANSDTTADACRTDCTPAGCGDGVIDGPEVCDDGAANSDTTADACRTDCTPAGCGDGAVDTAEACDDGAANSDTGADACRTTCVLPACGDNVVDTGETCDDGNTADGDQCGRTCQAPPALPAVVDLNAVPVPAEWRFTGVGTVLATGDFDGDGLDDLAFNDESNPVVRVVLAVDLPATTPATVDVPTAATLSVIGGPLSAIGYSIASGDLDDDGIDELIIGATGDASVYVILGATMATATLPAAFDLTTTPADVTITLPAGEAGGAAVATGDLSGDGIDDLVIGEPGHTPGAGLNGAGRALVVLGRTFTTPATIDGAAAAELQILGRDAVDSLGTTLATGDFDADGIGDVAIGAPLGDGAADAYADAGEVYLVRGRMLVAGAAPTVLATALGEYELVLQGGADPGAWLGRSVALVDLARDGGADLCAGAPAYDPALAAAGPGRVTCIYGFAIALGAGQSFDLASATPDGALTTGGAVATAFLGGALAAGDTNNDGFADLVISESGSDAVFAGAGRVHLWLGRALAGPFTQDLAVTAAEVTFLPASTDLQLGGALATGDVDGDGFSDVLIGLAPTAAAAYLVRGGVNPTP